MYLLDYQMIYHYTNLLRIVHRIADCEQPDGEKLIYFGQILFQKRDFYYLPEAYNAFIISSRVL